MGLTSKQQAFISEYLLDFNATQAAIRAGYSEKTAANIGYETVRKPEVAAAISKHLMESAMSADEVLMRLAEQARNDLAGYVDDFGFVDFARLKADGKGHLVKKFEIEQTATGRLKAKVEGYDAQAALNLLGKYHRLFADKVEHSGTIEVTAADYIEAMNRVRREVEGGHDDN